MPRSGTVTAGIALVLALLSACGGGNSSTAAPPSQSTTTSGATPSSSPSFNNHGTKTVTGASLHLEADNFYFEPSVIRGKPGAKIRVTIENSSATLHNFTVKSQHVDV